MGKSGFVSKQTDKHARVRVYPETLRQLQAALAKQKVPTSLPKLANAAMQAGLIALK